MRVHIFPERLDLTPGEPAAIQVDIFNDRDVIDSFVVSLLGLGAETLSVQPPELSLFPSSEGSVTIVFTPSADLAAGQRSAGVKVSSTTDATLSMIEPLPISVAQLTAVVLDVQPQMVSAGKRAHFALTVENQGNTKASVSLSGADAEHALEMRLSPSRLDVAPGGHKVARVAASGKRPLVGTPVARIVTFRADGAGPRQEVMGTFIQRPLVSQLAMTLVALLAAAAVTVLAIFAGFDKLLAHQAKTAATSPTTTAGAGAGKGAGSAGAGGAASGAGGAGGSGATGSAGSGQITGTVVGPSVTPASAATPPAPLAIAGAVVEAHPAANPTQLATATVADSSGTFTLTGLAPGAYKVRATAMGYQPLWYPAAATSDQGTAVTVAAGGVAPPITFTLDGLPGTVSGVIQSVTGPVVGAQVSIVGSNQPPVTTAADGSFSLTGLPTPATDQLTIAKTGFPTATESVTLSAGEQLSGQQLLLSIQSGTVSGTVSDNQGTPIGGAKVVVDDSSGAVLGSTTTMSAGTVGFFIVSGLPTPATDNVVVSANGYNSATSQVTVAAGMAAVNLSPQLTPLPLTLTGTVSRAATPGGPCPPCTLAGATVMATGKGANGTATTAANGSYTIPNLLPGQYTVTYAASGYTTTSATVTLAPGQNGTNSPTLVAPAIALTGNLTCTLLGLVPETVKISLATAAGAAVPGVAAESVTSPGSYAFSGVPSPGSYVVTFTYGSGPVKQNINVPAGQNVNAGNAPCG